MSKTTISSLVSANVATLSGMSHGQLFEWSRSKQLDNRSAFASFKKAIRAVGIDYDALRAANHEAKAEALVAACTHEVTLYSDAKARCERFAICDHNGEVVWFGRFFDGEGSEQSAAELEAAKKAIWLASKVRDAVGAKAIKLTLLVDAKWLCSLSGKAAVLADNARKMSVDLNMEWIAGSTNPADKWTVASGFRKWSDTPLETLAKELA